MKALVLGEVIEPQEIEFAAVLLRTESTFIYGTLGRRRR